MYKKYLGHWTLMELVQNPMYNPQGEGFGAKVALEGTTLVVATGIRDGEE
jgi:hypothetical protein